MIWVLLIIALVVWSYWPTNIDITPHYRMDATGQIKFVEYRVRSKT